MFKKNSYCFSLILTTLYSLNICAQVIPQERLVHWETAGSDFIFSSITDSVNVMDFGAIGDGISSDFHAITDAISSFNGNSGMVYFPAGTYRIDSTLNVPDSIILRGNGADYTCLKLTTGENQHGINISGAPDGNFIVCTGGHYKNSKHLILADSGGFNAGDIAELIQDGTQHMFSSWAMNCLGQIVKIDSANGYDIYLSSALRMDYQTSLNPRIRKINPVRAVAVQCLKIDNTNPTTSQTSNIFFNYAQNCEIKGIESNKCNFAHIEINKSTDITLRNSYIHDGHSYGSGGKAYGVCVHASSGECLTENNIFAHLRHSMLLQSGANGNVFTFNYSRDPYWTETTLPANSAGDIVLHGNYPYANLFEGNICQHIVIDDSHGKNGPYNTYFRNRAELYGIFMNNAPATDSVNFVGNEVTNTTLLMGLYMLNGNGHFQHGNNIKGTITPSGTNNLPDTSYFYNNIPIFWLSLLNFPLIGPPVPYNSLINPAKTRYNTGNELSYCNDTTFITTLNKQTNEKNNSFDVINVTYNKTSNSFEITINFYNQLKTEIILCNSIGVVIYKNYYLPNMGINKIIIPFEKTKSVNMFFITFIQSNYYKTLKTINL